MKKGIIYLMTTVVSGLVKIGKCANDQFENRMRFLESSGYANIVGLKREFAIEVDNYDEKEKLIHNIFSKSRIANTELFAVDVEILKSLLSSLDGKQIYPKDKSKKEIFKESTERFDLSFIPNGEYILSRNVKGFGKVNAKAILENGVFTLLAGSICADKTLQKDIICTSLSMAGYIVLGKQNNGWNEWKDLKGNPIKVYRDKIKSNE